MSGPIEVKDVVEGGAELPEHAGIERYASRSTEVGGVPVRRALPKREHRTIAAWCFVDHFGPASGPQGQMKLGTHPHMGLHTVTWLVEGEALHRDSLGSEQLIRPGQLNVMTAGRGVAHAEESDYTRNGVMHGAQLWVAQPDATRNGEAAFEHHGELPKVALGSSAATVMVGDIDGTTSPARADTPLVGAALTTTSAGVTEVPLRKDFEHGIVVLDGSIAIGDDVIVSGELVYLSTGRDEVSISTYDSAHYLLLGGEPFDEQVFMWWNFVARTREEIDEARDEWQARSSRFGEVDTRLDRMDAPQTFWRRG